MKITKKTRIDNINKLISEISKLDRCFFSSNQDVTNPSKHKPSYFFLKSNILHFFDSKMQQTFKARKGCMDKTLNGSTLNAQLEAFRLFIVNGEYINLFSRYWGYSYDSLIKIHELSKELGICPNADFILHDYSKNKDLEYRGKE